MKQTQLLSLFIMSLFLANTIQFSTNNDSINDIMAHYFKTPGLPSQRMSEMFSPSEDQEDNMQTESQTETETLASANFMKPYLTSSKVLLQNWFQIQGKAFANNKKFPELETADGNQKVQHNAKFERINPLYAKGSDSSPPTNLQFWFRLTAGYVYYTYNKKNMTIAGALKIKNITNVQWVLNGFGKNPCIILTDTSNDSWTVCGGEEPVMTKWFCKILKSSGLQKEDKCDPKNYLGGLDGGKVIIKTITQPIIIIPTPSKHCNVNWTYNKKGADWECMCKEGREQSPIDLPPPNSAIDTDVKPMFSYEYVEPVMTDDYPKGKLKSGEKNIITYDEYALRIRHPNFGKIVTLDGAVYVAQEIVFHTPSEHQIEGNVYDMEMQVIHYGKSVGDTMKQVILSFLFKAKPGVFNKFIDKLDFFDLPSPTDKFRELSQTLYLPHILLNSDDEDLSVMIPFSFYSYQGSTSAPPCNESTIHFVVSKPIELSNTALELFKEALRLPDRMDNRGNVVVSDNLMTNNRNVQPLNGRGVFHYDHTKYNCPDFRKISKNKIEDGHYEKRTKESVQYVFVNGYKPSGMPGAFVVSDKEANGN